MKGTTILCVHCSLIISRNRATVTEKNNLEPFDGNKIMFVLMILPVTKVRKWFLA